MQNLNLNQPSNQPSSQNMQSASRLGKCPDCGNMLSHSAISCPHCGAVMKVQRVTVDGNNWSFRIAWGVFLGYLLITVVNIALFIVGMLFFAGMFASAINNVPRR